MYSETNYGIPFRKDAVGRVNLIFKTNLKHSQHAFGAQRWPQKNYKLR